MYLSYYNLAVKPFQISTDPKFLWMGEKHKEALAILKYGILDNRGFLLLTGDVGTGKTTLINALINTLGDQIIVATVPDPGLEQLEFFSYVAQAFGMKQAFGTKGSFLVNFREFLYTNYANGKKVLLIIDEAQRLNQDLPEEIRLLSNIEKEDQKLLNIFFVGQNEFNDFLLENRNRALRQRITLNFNIDPLSETETHEYIDHRLFIAGSTRKIFTPDALHEIYNFSMGYPRLINIICDHALLTGFVEERDKIKSNTIKECATELSIPSHTQKSVEVYRKDFDWVNPAGKSKSPSSTFKRIFGYSLIILLTILITLLLISPGKIDPYFSSVTGFFKKNSDITSREDLQNPQDLPPALSPENPSQKQTPSLKEPLSNMIQKQPSVPPALPVDSQTQQGQSAAETAASSKSSAPLIITEQKLVIYYGYNSNDLSKEAIDILDRLSKTMLVDPTIKIDIKGYTDTTGSHTYNLKLSEFRANIVKSYLVAKGVNPSNINATGRGPESPIVKNELQNEEKSNRRVEIELHY